MSIISLQSLIFYYFVIGFSNIRIYRILKFCNLGKMFKVSVFTLVTYYCLVVSSSNAKSLDRHRRGASVYVTFPSGGGSSQSHSSPFSDNQSFYEYLGGSPGASYGSSSSSSGGGGSGYVDSSSLLNQFQLSGYAGGSGGSARTTRSNSGWQPSTSASSYGGGGGNGPSFSPYFGAIAPNFATYSGSSSGGSTSSCPSCPGSSAQPNPVSASGLLHSAASSFNAQTAYFNSLTAGSRYTPYKGGR